MPRTFTGVPGNLPPPKKNLAPSSEIWPPSETWISKLNKKCNAM